MSRANREREAHWVLKEQAFRVAVAKAGFRTLSEVAQAAKMQKSRVSTLIAGLRCGDGVAEKLAGTLGVPVSRIFNRVEPMRPLQTDLPLDAKGVS